MPTGGERSRFRFAIADHATGHKVGIVEDGPVSMRQCVAEFSAFMDGAGCLRRIMAGDASREGELLEQLSHALFVLLNVGVELRVCAFKIGVRHHAGPAVPGTANVDDIEVILLDQAVEVHVDEVEPGRRAPVTKQPRLHVLKLQRLAQQRIS